MPGYRDDRLEDREGVSEGPTRHSNLWMAAPAPPTCFPQVTRLPSLRQCKDAKLAAESDKMTCYHCAEEILAAATLCRYCQQPITPANRKGLPNWYKSTGSRGFHLLWIQEDLEQHILGSSGNLTCLQRDDPVEQAYSIAPNEEEWDMIRALIRGCWDRINEIHRNPRAAVEAAFLSLLIQYYTLFIDLLHPEEPEEAWRPDNLRMLKGMMDKARDSADMQVIPEDLRDQFIRLFNTINDSLERHAARISNS